MVMGLRMNDLCMCGGLFVPHRLSYIGIACLVYGQTDRNKKKREMKNEGLKMETSLS